MAVEKNTHLLTKDDRHQPGDYVLRSVSQHPGLSVEAKGLWLWLYSHPSGWRFNSEHVERECGIGKQKRQRIYTELEAAGLIELRTARGGGGSFAGTELVVFAAPQAENQPPEPEKPAVGFSGSPKTGPHRDNTGLEITEDRDSSASASKAATADAGPREKIPDDWEPSTGLMVWTLQTARDDAVELDWEREIDDFRDYWLERADDPKDTKSRKSNWDMTWRRWARKLCADAYKAQLPHADREFIRWKIDGQIRDLEGRLDV